MDGGSSYTYYGGGGAGDPIVAINIEGSIGGGGGTLSKNGVDGLGGGGAGSGGRGGSGKCIISYKPITTPPPTTTTTPPPAAPGAVVDFTLEGLYRSVKGKWLPPTDQGTSDITDYEIQLRRGSEIVYSEQILVSELQTEGLYYTLTISDLDDLQDYQFNVSAINDVGQGEITFLTTTTVTTTPTTTTTIPPSNSVVGVDIDGDITQGYIEISSLSLNAPPGSTRQLTSSIKASGDFVFYEEPTISIFGDILPHIQADNITHSINETKDRISSSIPVIVPNEAETLGSLYIVAEAVETTTTTTTTSTTILPDLCADLYNDADFDIVVQDIVDGEPSINNYIPNPDSEDSELIYLPPSGEELALRPLQVFVSETTFPTNVVGTILPNSIVPGYPWHNSSYYELARTEDDGFSYIDQLPENYNIQILQGQDENGNHILFNNMFYMLEYPPVNDNQILEAYSELIYSNPETLHSINLTIRVDYVCTVTDSNVYGSGNESVDGFLSLTITESKLDAFYTLENKQVSRRDIRMHNSFTSVITGETYYYILDYGVREKILGT